MIPGKVKVDNIGPSNKNYFCCPIHILLYLCCVRLSTDFCPLSSNNFEMIKFSNTHSFMHRYRYVQNTTMLGGRQKCYRANHEFPEPAEFFAAKQDILQNFTHTRIYFSTCFCLGLCLQPCRYHAKIHLSWKHALYRCCMYFPTKFLQVTWVYFHDTNNNKIINDNNNDHRSNNDKLV